MIKFQKDLKDYKYLVMFDLASKNTGVCVYNIQKSCIITTHQISVSDTEEHELALYKKLEQFFAVLEAQIPNFKANTFVSKEAMPVQVHGGASTVFTFLALAKAHAILNFFLAYNHYDYYDETGIYPISTHSYLKKLLEDKDKKITKDEIKNYLIKERNVLPGLSYDEYDAIFLAITLIEQKWNKDLDDKIRELKKHKKILINQKAIDTVQSNIDKLLSFKNTTEEVCITDGT